MSHNDKEKNFEYADKSQYACPINCALEILGGKWVLQIICALNKESRIRFGKLKREIPHISNPMLSHILKELQTDNLVNRTQYNEVPLRVEYSLTQEGKNIIPSLYRIAQLGLNCMNAQGKKCTCKDKCYISNHRFLQPDEINKVAQYPDYWDENYIKLGKTLESQEMLAKSGVERLKWFLSGILKVLTTGDIEINRMILVYLNGLNEPKIALRTRPHYLILGSLIDECKKEKAISQELSTSFLADFLIKIVDGMQTAYLMKDKTSLEENTAYLFWFIDALKFSEFAPTSNIQKISKAAAVI